MNRTTFILFKTLAWIACLAPFCWLVWGAVTNNLGPDPTAAIAFSTGLTTLRLLTITLAITPLRRLGASLIPPLAAQFNWLIKFRRLFGLFAFFYASLHMLTYVALYSGFSLAAMESDIAKRRFITMGSCRLSAACAACGHIHHMDHPQARRQKLEPAAQAHLCRRHLRSGSLLVAG